MVKKSTDLSNLLAETLAGLDPAQVTKFRQRLSEILPTMIEELASEAREEESNMSKATNKIMDNFIRGEAGRGSGQKAPPQDTQKLLERAEVYIEKTGCSVEEAFELVGLRPSVANEQPGSSNEKTQAGNMNDWLRTEANK